MKKNILLLFLLPFFVNGQDNNEDVGVKFERNITIKKWDSIFERAKKEEKYVFVYVNVFNYQNNNYGDKAYAENYKARFSNSRVGNYFNSKFINVFIQPSRGYTDTKYQTPLPDALILSYRIYSFPAVLIFDNTGNIVHKYVGIERDSLSVINQAAIAFDKNERYYSLIEQFNNGRRDSSFLKKFFKTTIFTNDSTDKYVLDFIKSRDNLFTKENADILMHSYSHIVAFDYLYSNQDIWKKIIEEDVLENFYKQEIARQVSETYYFVYNFKMYADELIRQFDSKYPKYGKEVSVKFLLRQWLLYDPKNPELDYIVRTYIDSNFIVKFTVVELNFYAWSAFLSVTDTFILNQALSWSKKSLAQDKDNLAYLDTYANLLYKLGQTKEAIEIETKAVELINEKEKKSYQETLDKMKAGKPTWK